MNMDIDAPGDDLHARGVDGAGGERGRELPRARDRRERAVADGKVAPEGAIVRVDRAAGDNGVEIHSRDAREERRG
jgi:hypothetical protein